jgi:oxygen-dependent protoporphyrinogen oxidase
MVGRMRVAVVGAGIAGLTCARELGRAGLDVEVFEREPTVGGRMNTRTRDGLAFDVGANFLIREYRELGALAAELGIALRQASPVDHVVYRGGRRCGMNFTSIRDAFRMDALRLRTKLRLGAFVFAVRRAWPGLDFFDLGLAPDTLNDAGEAYDYARRRVGPDFADYVVDAFNSAMLFSRATHTSAAAFVSLFAMMTDPRCDFSILFAEGGMRAIPEAIAGRLVVHRGQPVLALRPEAGGWRATTAAASAVFDRVVLATTPAAALALLEDAPAPHLELLARTRYASTINVSFRVPQGALGRAHCFYVPWVESRLIAEFTNEQLKGPLALHDGCSLVNVGLHDAAARALMDASDAAVFAQVRAELLRLDADLQAVAEQVRPHDLQRWPEAVPCYDTGHLPRVRQFLRDGQGRQGLYLCGDYLNAPWLEGACRSGRKAARQLLGERGQSPRN